MALVVCHCLITPGINEYFLKYYICMTFIFWRTFYAGGNKIAQNVLKVFLKNNRFLLLLVNAVITMGSPCF